MRLAALYDIHANLPALEAVLHDIRQSDVHRIVVGGDVLPGPMPRETLEHLLAIEIPMQFIRGNGDRVVLAQMSGHEPTEVPEQFRDAIRWNAKQLGRQHAESLTTWPPTLQIKVGGLGDVLFCHATPRNDTDIFTRLTTVESLVPVFKDVRASLVVCGHIHMQFDRKIAATRVVNAGSVGMPFGNPGAYWLLLDSDHQDQVQLRHTAYDLAKAADRIRATHHPQAHDFAENNVLRPPSEEKMLELFKRVELK
jgi:putative phosphoesterase